MGFWFWFFTYLAIALAGLTIYAVVGLQLLKKLKAFEAPAKTLAKLAAKLEATSKAEVTVDSPVAALDQTEHAVTRRKNQIAKARKEKKEAKERRLVARLKHLDIDESRLRK
jgi:uncharacterized protein (DUF2384 family)